MTLLSFLQGLPLERQLIVVPKISTISIKYSLVPIGFPQKVNELLTYYTFYLSNNSIIYFVPLFCPVTLIPIPERSYIKC